MGVPGTSRRPLLKLAAGGAALVTVGAAARLTLYSGDGDEPFAGDTLALSTHAGTDVQSLHLALGDSVLPNVGPGRWESRRLPTSTHSLVAFTWSADQRAPTASVRSRSGGIWGPWVQVPLLHDLPDMVSRDAVAVVGTDLVWIGQADGVQIRVEGRRPRGLTLVLIYPERRPGDLLVAQPSSRVVEQRQSAESESESQAQRPALVTRKEWGANESLRDGSPTYIHTIKQVHVHHTVNSNNYARDDVPALIRGMYAYHTQSLGWSDIGYNFLVDRFGRGWVGRAGGPAKLVRGAHTLGFNAESTGISAIGNYDTVQPSNALLNTIAAISAWKLDPFDRDPRARIRVKSEGSDKYAAGRGVRLPVIDGHRDTNDTACPGQHLYEALPKIRRRTERIMAAAKRVPITIDEPATVGGLARLGGELRIEPGTYRPAEARPAYQWLRSEEPIPGAREQTYQVRPEDVGHTISCLVTLEQAGLDPVSQTPQPVGPVTAEPVVAASATARRRVARVRVSIASPSGVSVQPSGRVIVKVGGRTRTLGLDSGGVVARFGRRHRLDVGTHAVKVAYSGDASFAAATWVGTVRIG